MESTPAENDDGRALSAATGVVTLESRRTVDDLLRAVKSHLDQVGLTLFAVIDHSGEAHEIGLDMPDTKLMIFGNPAGGTPVMLAHPLVALDLPIRLLLWATPDGRTHVSYNTPEYLATRFGLTSQETDALRVVESVARAVTSE